MLNVETNLQSEDCFKKWRHDGKHVDLNLNWLSKVQEVSTYWNIRRNHSLTREKDVLDIGDIAGNWGYESKRGHHVKWRRFWTYDNCQKVETVLLNENVFYVWTLLESELVFEICTEDISSRGTYWTLETWWKRGWFRKWRQICKVSVERKSEKKKTFSNQAGMKKVFVASNPGVF